MLGTVATAREELAGTDFGTWCDSELRETYVEVRRDIDCREAFAARLLAAIHGRRIPAGDGAVSTPAWSQFQTGQRVGEAKVSLDAGRAGEVLALTGKAWADGEISASAACAITRGIRERHEAVYAAIEATLLDRAKARDLRSLDLLIAHYHARCDAIDDRDPAELNGLHLSRVGNRWKLNGDLDALAGVTHAEALRAATDPPRG